MEAVEHLRCPVTRASLERRGSELVAGEHRYRIVQHQGGEFVDFLASGPADAAAEAQRVIYDDPSNRYRAQLDADPGFMRQFVDHYVAGRVKNKDALLRAALRDRQGS